MSLEHSDLVFTKIVEHIIRGVGAETAVEYAKSEYGCDPYFKSSILCVK